MLVRKCAGMWMSWDVEAVDTLMNTQLRLPVPGETY